MSDHRPRLCIVPRWGANQAMEWYDWLCATDVVRDSFSAVIRPDAADWQAPTVDSWTTALHSACGGDPDALANTWFIAHSVGCQGVVRYLASLPAGVTVARCLLVAGWWELDEPWDSIRPWVYTGEPDAAPGAGASEPIIDLARVRAACSDIHTLISDDDPFTSDWQKTRRDWQTRVNARVQVIPGAKHFNGESAPAVRDALIDMIAAAG